MKDFQSWKQTLLVLQSLFYLDSKYSLTSSEQIIIQKSSKSEQITSIMKSVEMCTPVTEDISDDDIPITDIRKHKTKSIDALSLPSSRDSVIPLATDLQSLPGHSQSEIRDTRFLNYADIETLSMHFSTCLYVDQKCSSPAKQYTYKTCHNVWNKILKLYYVKTFRKRLFSERSSNKTNRCKQQPLSLISSPTSTSFKMEWNVNRRHSSSVHRHTPKNIFHILQLNPKKQFSFSSTQPLPTPKTPTQTLERIKDILARTYYPHFYTAIEYGYQFGSKSKFPNTRQLISTHNDTMNIKEMPESPYFIDDSVTITLKSPPSFTKHDTTVTQQIPAIESKNKDKCLSPTHNERQANEDADLLSPWKIRQSVVVLTPTTIPLTSSTLNEDGTNLNVNRKRKSSPALNSNIIERKKKRIVLSPLPDTNDVLKDFSDTDRYLYIRIIVIKTSFRLICLRNLLHIEK